MMDMMLPGGLLGWGLIVREQHERLLAEARGDRLARAARAKPAPRPGCGSSARRFAARRRAVTADQGGIDR